MRGPAKAAAPRPSLQIPSDVMDRNRAEQAEMRLPDRAPRGLLVTFADGGHLFLERHPNRPFELEANSAWVHLVCGAHTHLWRASDVESVQCSPGLKPPAAAIAAEED